MKRFKQIVNDVKERVANHNTAGITPLLWQFICYPPKIPLRLHQEQLLAQATRFSVKVDDPYFTNSELTINGFKWGEGKTRILISHGWGSKAADFTELINALLEIPDLEIIAHDAPANGSSDGDLSNLLLFVNAIKAVIVEAAAPDIAIGHSFGAMANVVALHDLGINPKLLISIAPFILLQENFIKNMTALDVPVEAQQAFLDDFKARYGIYPSSYNMPDLYRFDASLNHWLAYDDNDMMLPDAYLQSFLKEHPSIRTKNFSGAGHERIIKLPEVIADVVGEVKSIVK
ncbi:alpha/beta hydrolase [Mucilaginibacter conchicola]|uniref:Alpha/beta hydrolase n=1 Tax=Mucilaginibacter conchicola TaxID=2303333 RepID=A0A372NV53_9SPHI|nr:alpha/beta hydrolase [Mucilaginibacter conchicola]RFZ92982.1 alpha/beta hydrolase [Mucilaginibacter conchicola]